MSEYAIKTLNPDAADRAVRLSASDAETHSARAVVLQQNGDNLAAQSEIERAVQLRPRDYQTWMLLGLIRDDNQDQAGTKL